jgi:hypothetical protein
MYTYNCTYKLDHVSHNLQRSTVEEGLESFHKSSGREVGKRVRVKVYKPK